MEICIMNNIDLLYILIAFTIVVLIRVVGIILVIALLTTPPAIAKQFTVNLKSMMIYSILIGMFFCLLGLYISYVLGVSSGASIIILLVVTYFLIAGIRHLYKKIIK